MECANSHSNGDPLVGKYKSQRSADRWSGSPRSGLVVGIILNSMKLLFSSLSKSNLIAQSLANDRLSKLTNYVILFLDVITSARQQFGGGLVGSSSSCDSSSSSSCDSPRHSPSLTNSSSSSQTSSPSPRKQVGPGLGPSREP